MRRGANTSTDTRIGRPGEAGMTLIEMLIVLSIIAIAAGATALGIGAATRKPSAESEARRLATRLQAAADDAMLGDRLFAFTAQRHSYGFASYSESGGLVPRTDDAFGPHTVPDGMTITLNVRPPVLLGDGSGKAMVATIESGDQQWNVAFDGLTAVATQMTVAPASRPAA